MEWFIWPFVVLPIILITVIMVFGFLIWNELAKLNLKMLDLAGSIDNLSLAVCGLKQKPKRKTKAKKKKE